MSKYTQNNANVLFFLHIFALHNGISEAWKDQLIKLEVLLQY